MKIDTMWRAAALGYAAGLRSMTPLAAVSWAGRLHRLSLPDNGPLSLLDRPPFIALATVAALGESIVDKTVALPPRVSSAPLLARMGSGALAGGAVGAQEDLVLGASIGAAAAVAGTHAGYRARMGLVRAGIPDVLAALVGDALAVGLSLAALASGKI